MKGGTPVLQAALAFTVVAGLCTGCSDSFWDPWGISFHLSGTHEVTRPQLSETIPFTAEGAPVDDGVICQGGVATIDRLESTEGSPISFDDWEAIFETAQANKNVVEVYSFQSFECSDGSGSFSMKVSTAFDFSKFVFEGEQDVGRWAIEGGTGSYSNLEGSGDVTVDYDNDDVKYGGDAHT